MNTLHSQNSDEGLKKVDSFWNNPENIKKIEQNKITSQNESTCIANKQNELIKELMKDILE